MLIPVLAACLGGVLGLLPLDLVDVLLHGVVLGCACSARQAQLTGQKCGRRAGDAASEGAVG